MTLMPEIIVDCFAGGGGASEGLERFSVPQGWLFGDLNPQHLEAAE